MSTSEVVKRVAEMLRRYATEVGMRMIDDLRSPDAKIVVTKDGGVGVSMADVEPHWFAYADAAFLSTIDRWEEMAKLAGQSEPNTVQRIKLEIQAFKALIPAMADQLAAEACREMYTVDGVETDFLPSGLREKPPVDSTQNDHTHVSQEQPRSTAPIWLTGVTIAVAGAIFAKANTHSIVGFGGMETVLGYAVGIMALPTIICAFSRFRLPWLFVGLTALATVAAYVGTPKLAPGVSINAGIPVREDWASTSSRFVMNHPALLNGEDQMIFREKYNQDDGSLSTQGLLEKAYQEAKSDPRWVDVR